MLSNGINMAGKRGGYMPGGGRPKGALNKKTQELIIRATEEGISPLDVLLNGMREFYSLAEREYAKIKGHEFDSEDNIEKFKSVVGFKNLARDYARDAAPYVHPKLASLQANVNVNNVEAELAELE